MFFVLSIALQRILDIHRHDFVRNADINCITNKPALSFFGSLYCSDTVSFAVTQLEGAVVAIFLTYKHNRIKWALARFFTSCTL